jgi:hypothetical protein
MKEIYIERREKKKLGVKVNNEGVKVKKNWLISNMNSEGF